VNTDLDVQNYVAALRGANLSIDESSIAALATFVASAKANGYWNSLVEVYPFCGDTLAAQLYKLKAHASLSRVLTWTNGVGSTDALCAPRSGITSNNLAGAGSTLLDSGLVPATHLASNISVSFGLAVSPQSVATGYEMGCYSVAGSQAFALAVDISINTVVAACGSTGGWDMSHAVGARPSGFYIATRTAASGASSQVLYRNGSAATSASTAAVALPTIKMGVCGRQLDGTSWQQSAHRQAFAFVGNGLDAATAATFSNDVAILLKNLRRVL
jgi:hypothetical protein